MFTDKNQMDFQVPGLPKVIYFEKPSEPAYKIKYINPCCLFLHLLTFRVKRRIIVFYTPYNY
jgi:hypothetical protein